MAQPPAKTPPLALAVVPARLGSTRLPRKMLLCDSGAPLVVETARNAWQSGVFAHIVVAADTAEIVDAVSAAGFRALFTSPDHPSGTDRVRDALEQLAQGGTRFDVVVNVQGDEPELGAADLAALVSAFHDPAVEFASLWAPLAEADADAPATVKVALDRSGNALYFSRSKIPARGHGGEIGSAVGRANGPDGPWKRHVGVYAYRPDALSRFCDLPEGELEALERLEQLRWLENGGRIRMLRAQHLTRGIDTPRDYAEYVERSARRRAAPKEPSAT